VYDDPDAPDGPGEGRADRLVGFFGLVVNLDELVREVDRNTTPRVRLRLTMTDPLGERPDAGDGPYYARLWADRGAGPPSVGPQPTAADRPTRSLSHPVADRSWKIEIRPTDAWLAEQGPWYAAPWPWQD
jgi:hypothetical protein